MTVRKIRMISLLLLLALSVSPLCLPHEILYAADAGTIDGVTVVHPDEAEGSDGAEAGVFDGGDGYYFDSEAGYYLDGEDGYYPDDKKTDSPDDKKTDSPDDKKTDSPDGAGADGSYETTGPILDGMETGPADGTETDGSYETTGSYGTTGSSLDGADSGSRLYMDGIDIYDRTSNFIQNASNGNQAILDDGANLINESDKVFLREKLYHLTEFSNIAFVTISSNPAKNAQTFAEQYNEQHFSGSSGIVLLIDMDNRYIYIDSIGNARSTLTSAYANTITDNIYQYASNGSYYTCASKALEQMQTLFEGGRIAQPMKHLGNALLSLVLAALFNFILVTGVSRKRQASNGELLTGMKSDFHFTGAREQFLNQTKSYQPRSSGSSGGGGGRSGGGGGGGGGGHSGGGHSF